MVLRVLLINYDDPAVRVERCKLLASACQVIAITLLAAAVLAPLFNPSLTTSFWMRLAGGAAVAPIELLALRILGYISAPVRTED
jgi:hypothetical protein